MTDRITILRHSHNLLAKTWRADGTIKPYDDAKFFTRQEVAVGSLDELSALLTTLQGDPHRCVIRGRYVGDELATFRDPERQAGKVRRALDYFDDQPLHAVLIDVDKFKPLMSDPAADLDEAMAEFIFTQLPEPFHAAGYHWQLSNSAGHASKLDGELRVHLWFWLDTPRTSAELKAWAKASGLAVDKALFNPVQVHYTAAPVMDPGVIDPVEIRCGLVRGDPVALVIDPDVIAQAERPASGRGQRLRDVAAEDPVAQRLAERAMIKSAVRDGFNIECPFEDGHTPGSGGESSTQYFLPNTGGRTLGNFKCLHDSCSSRRRGEFLARLGIDEVVDDFDAVVAYSDKVDFTDRGNANLLAARTKGDLRYVVEWRSWLVWAHDRWELDTTGEHAFTATGLVAEHYASEIIKLQAQLQGMDRTAAKQHQKTIDAVASWEKACRSRRGIDNMLALASKHPAIVIGADRLDTDPHLLGVQNGVVDLRTSQLRPDAREDFVTRRCAHAYRPGASSERWVQFVREVTGLPLDAEKDPATDVLIPASVGRYIRRPHYASYLQRALGYTATGLTREHKLFTVFGEHGSNGKNVLFDAVMRVLGPYATPTSPKLLLSGARDFDANRATPALAALRGARLVLSSEPPANATFDPAMLKALTGETTISVRANYGDAGPMPLTFSLWLLCNAKPRVEHLEQAIVGRLLMLPFDRRWNRPGVVDHNPALPDPDKHLASRLADEGEGILAWLIEGAAAYFADGLEPCSEVVDATRSYFKEQQVDPVGRWLDEQTQCPPQQGEQARVLFHAFQAWRVAHEAAGSLPPGGSPVTQTAFSLALKRHGIDSAKHGVIRYGVRLASGGGADFEEAEPTQAVKDEYAQLLARFGDLA